MNTYAILMFVAIANLVILAITAWSPNPTGERAMKVVGFSTIIGFILIIIIMITYPIDLSGAFFVSSLLLLNQP